MQPTRAHSSFMLRTGQLLLILTFVLLAYTFLHEAGHALTGLIFGQSLTAFNVNFWDLSAHVDLAGGHLTQPQLAVRSAAGAGLALLSWGLFICIVPRKASFTIEVLKLFSSMMFVNTLLVWIFLPVLFLAGQAPSDDVTYFLRYSQVHPLLLALIAAVLYTGGWILFLKKIDGLRNEFLLFSVTDRKQLTAGTRRSLPVMGAMLVFILIVVITLNAWGGANPVDRFSPPQDFSTVSQVDLAQRAYMTEPLAQFSLDQPTYVGVFIAIREINTTYFDLSVVGPQGFSSIVMHGEGYKADQDGGLWEKNLPPGNYQLVLTSHQSPGKAFIYCNVPFTH